MRTEARSLAPPLAPPTQLPQQTVGTASNGFNAGLGDVDKIEVLRQAGIFPELESYDEIGRRRDDYLGPTMESNWVLPGKLLVGAYPASMEDNHHAHLLCSILLQGVSTFVCLQQEYLAEGVTEKMWRSGDALRPYYQDVLQLLRKLQELRKCDPMVYPTITEPDKTDFVHFPIVDCNVADDTKVLLLAANLADRVAKGEVMYLHCWGGHGRTGTVVSIMLHLMYGLDAKESMDRCQFVHDVRRIPINVGSPQTEGQRQQVQRVVQQLVQRRATMTIPGRIGLSGQQPQAENESRNEKVVAIEGEGKGEQVVDTPVEEVSEVEGERAGGPKRARHVRTRRRMSSFLSLEESSVPSETLQLSATPGCDGEMGKENGDKGKREREGQEVVRTVLCVSPLEVGASNSLPGCSSPLLPGEGVVSHCNSSLLLSPIKSKQQQQATTGATAPVPVAGLGRSRSSAGTGSGAGHEGSPRSPRPQRSSIRRNSFSQPYTQEEASQEGRLSRRRRKSVPSSSPQLSPSVVAGKAQEQQAGPEICAAAAEAAAEAEDAASDSEPESEDSDVEAKLRGVSEAVMKAESLVGLCGRSGTLCGEADAGYVGIPVRAPSCG
ncbi:unnamed protein product [Choristocarpus tenellus]